MMQSLLKLTRVEIKLFVREPGVYFGLAFPLAFLFIFGSIYGNAPSIFFHGRGALDVSMPAYIVMVIVSNAFFALPIAMVNYRKRGILFRLQATPLHPLSIRSQERNLRWSSSKLTQIKEKPHPSRSPVSFSTLFWLLASF